MIVTKTMNDSFLHINLMQVQSKTELQIVTARNPITGARLGLIVNDEDEKEYVIFPAHALIIMDSPFQQLFFVHKTQVIAYVKPSEIESFEPYVDYDVSLPGAGWIGGK